MRVLVTGAAGQLGKAVVRELSGRHQVFPTTIDDLDICDHEAVVSAVRTTRPDAVVNCAAYTDVDGSEDHPVNALQVNAFAVRSLGIAARASGAVLVHYSSDFVFDGETSQPYIEEDPPNPRSTYACSKLLGEWLSRDAPRHYVLRVESLFGALDRDPSGRRTSVDRIIDTLALGEVARVFADRTVSPSYIADVAWATERILSSPVAPGLYHCVNSGSCTWPQLAEEIGRQMGITPRLESLRMAEARLKAERPRYCALSNGKLARAGLPMPSWQDSIARHLCARGLARG
jgi:dTDP-4-dehydrorhamnose reductase